jgi:predicted RNase H-like HicB family nuclease
VDEAIAMAKEAIELYVEELRDRGEDVPDDSNTLEYSLNLEMA